MPRMIADHSFWAGGKPKNSVLPDGAKTKEVTSAEGVGHLSEYEDTTEAIKASQELAKKQVHKDPRKRYERN